MSLTSDPHAWLRPYFAALAQDHTFALRAPSTQFSALCDAVRDDHPTKAELMQEWSPAAQESALRWLATCVTAGSAQREVELWNVEKTGRELRCVARNLPAGIDLRLMQGQEFRRTELHREADAATARATAQPASTARWRTFRADRSGFSCSQPLRLGCPGWRTSVRHSLRPPHR